MRTEKRVYDDKGNLAWETFYDREFVLGSHHYSHHSDGTDVELAHVRRSSANGKSVAAAGMSTSQFRWTHKSDVAGNRTESVVQTVDGATVRRFVYSYDASGKLSSAAQYKNNELLAEKWVYDSAVDVNEHDRFDEAGSLIERDYYSYEYDSRKNWVKRITSRQMSGAGEARSVPFEVAYRTIVYYPPVGEFQMSGGVIPGGSPQSAGSQPNMISSRAIERAEPVYPTAARAAHISGSVVVEVTVDEEGDVLSARAISGRPLLRDAALDAAWDWKFSPMIYRGRPIKVVGAIQFNFLS